MAEPGHLLHVFSTFAVGGPEVRTCDIINHFGPAYRHTIIAMDGAYHAKERIVREASVEYVKLDFDKKSTARNVRLFRKTLKRIRPDVLLTYNWGTIEWAMANRLFPCCPQIHGEDGFGPDEVDGQKKRRVLLRRIFLARAFRVVVPSQNLYRIAREVWRLPAEKVQHIPNGIDLEKFAGRGAGDKSDAAVVGTVAALRKEKNLRRLLRVFSTFSPADNAQLWIVGVGPEKESLEKEAEELGFGDRVRFWGYVEDPGPLLRKMDIFAISSDTEQMPISVLEAMASGCSIISTDVGDVKNMVCGENRPFVIPKEEEKTYGARLGDLIQDEALREKLGRGNREKCSRDYDKARMFQTYQSLYDSAVQASRRSNF